MANSVGYHESEGRLTPQTLDMHRALTSLQEELEAVDWYQQRVDATGDPELREILRHNRDEEQEHAAMVLEWIRRHDANFDAKLREYLFTEGSITGREAVATGNGGNGSKTARGGQTASRGATTVGSLRGGR
jgi:ferritin-like protein